MNDTTASETPEAPRGPNVRFNAERVKSSYCNVANAISSREEVVLNFGVNTSWDRAAASQIEVDLEHRIVLTPHAAKRFHELLGRLIADHETRYGPLGS